MSNIYNISIILSFAGLWITSLFPSSLETLLGFILIFSFGILHGSNDILLINSLSKDKVKYPFITVLVTYIFTVTLAVIIFYILPILALGLFILFSAFHFGEQHWEYRKLNISNSITNAFYFSYGMLILQLLFVLNPTDVIEVVEAITSYAMSFSIILYCFIVTAVIFTMLSAYLYFKSHSFRQILLKELFYLLVFTVVFKVSTLIWGFTIYFILWHSIPSLYEQVHFIYKGFNKTTILKYCKNAFPYWMISLIGIFVVYLFFQNHTIFYAVFFSFIAAVTFPHAIVINKMFSNKKTQSN
jgi:Brp/Blh family beta-carotene 15,15'-monooxygenase